LGEEELGPHLTECGQGQAMVRWLAMTFGMMTLFDPFKPSDEQKFD